MPYGMEQIVSDRYRPRNPRDNNYYRCTQDHFEQLEMVWDDRYERRYGFWRPYVMDVILRYLECGDLHFGFARVKCADGSDGKPVSCISTLPFCRF